ncbi:MAG: helix-turn-helix transcriptional regulator [Acidimicrobiales bacterium]
MAVMRRVDLAEFLRARRHALEPDAVGLAPGPRRRTRGLRREEVARLAGVSVSWFTWLEQGRPINVSADVLDALARALRLDGAERDHLFRLAGHAPPAAPRAERGELAAWVAAYLDALDPTPAYVLGPRWEFLAWNRAQEALYPAITELTGLQRNLVWVVFAEPQARTLIVDWEQEARRVLSQFRADVAPWRDDPAVLELVEDLRTRSDAFAGWWSAHDVAALTTRTRRYAHPAAGLLTFDYQVLVPAGEPDLRVVAQLGVPGDDSVARLAALRQSGIT